MSTKHPPSGPTEQEVREHFGDKLKADAKLMRPAYTSIWALEDGTLLWDWRNGFAVIGSAPIKHEIKMILRDPPDRKGDIECIMYVTGKQATGKQATGKSNLVRLMGDAVEVNLRSVTSRLPENIKAIVQQYIGKQTIVFTDQFNVPNIGEHIRSLAEELGVKFYSINLTRN